LDLGNKKDLPKAKQPLKWAKIGDEMKMRCDKNQVVGDKQKNQNVL